ncbi:BamA/TamA family outer membrane protein [Trichlorobacter lovleyi]|uniref:Surface antigen (D15) n=1 Tax=Trichlorobacter lovleyi (strain ATCC BAA-1151 / DSM 17278 / SZ) TaxID=398767 RepID=B3E211_TRIL1|nr:BamA/TamA family outer membrane protein [Trichlorobacter lovleyi]ACD97114.1 surface antigen (D15) [Trichlorobacter lovleyi SZ]
MKTLRSDSQHPWHRFPGRSFILALLILASGCTTTIPRTDLPLITNESCGDQVKVVTVPLPVIASSPNEGITAGALSAFLIHDTRDEIYSLLAPQLNYNQNFGFTGTLYGSVNPSPEQNIEFNLSQSQKKNFDYEARIRDISLMNGNLELKGFLGWFADGSSRFFGFHARTPGEQETNYTNREITYNLSATWFLGRHYYLELGHRFRSVSIGQGAITSVPFITEKFAKQDVPGVEGFTTHAPRISLIYSTYDSKTLPTYGGYARITFEPTIKLLGGAEDYRHYEVEAKGYLPHDQEKRFISVFRLMYNQTLGDTDNSKVPFLEQSILGGENTLRGYGKNRFIDNSFLLLNLEERIRLFRWEIFNVTADWEVAPFIDLGAVMESFDKASSRNFEFNPGVGFRATVRPNIVGRVDIGVGKDGPAVYVGLGYPF